MYICICKLRDKQDSNYDYNLTIFRIVPWFSQEKRPHQHPHLRATSLPPNPLLRQVESEDVVKEVKPLVFTCAEQVCVVITAGK